MTELTFLKAIVLGEKAMVPFGRRWAWLANKEWGEPL